MLNNREIKMLDIFSSGEEVSIKKLKEKFDISERMVRYDIEKINFVLSIFNIRPIYRNKSGTFKLDSNNKINKIKVMVKEAEPIDIEKRKKLIKLLLITSAKKTNVSNLMDKFDTSRITINNDLNIIKKEFEGKGYGDFKKAVADAVCAKLEEIQTRYNEILNSDLIETTLASGAKKARALAEEKLNQVQKAIGMEIL